jgi:protein involved in polysaccharide export with SLBB domain/capsular polysaccharide biosynthesis protein
MNDESQAGKGPVLPTTAGIVPATTGEQSRNGAAGSSAVDFLPLLEAVLRQWRWLVAGGGALGVLGFIAGFAVWKSSYTAPAQLMRYESPNAVEVFGVRQAAPQTLPSILHSPELLQRVGAKANPPVSADMLAANLRIMPEHDSDIIVVTVTGRNPQKTVDLANLYAREAVRYTQEMQAKAAGEIIQFTKHQLEQVESEIAAVNRQEQLPSFSSAIVPQTSTLVEKIQSARDDLAGLLARYTDEHPLVQAKRAEIAALEKELPSQASPGGETNTAAFASSDPEVIRSKLASLESARLTLIGRRQEAESLVANPPGYCQLLATASEKDLVKHGRGAKILLLAAFMGMLGLVTTAAGILLVEISDDRLKSAADVKRVARLPVLATAGDFAQMTRAQMENWAFRTWTNLQGRLSASPNHGLVCGVTSAGHGEGRSTWVNQLANAASQLGFRVLTIATRPTHATVDGGEPADNNESDKNREADPVNRTGDGYAKLDCPHCGQRIEYPENTEEDSFPCPECEQSVSIPRNQKINQKTNQETGVQQNVLSSPGEVAQKLMGPEPQPIVHIPLPGWVWNLERRKQWQAALRDWSQIENVVILVELPPASEPEAVLLAENLPNLIWLAASGESPAGETREQLETLRYARCKLAGAVLNHAPKSILQNKFRRWVNYATVLLAASFSTVQAADLPDPQTTTNQAGETNLSFSVVSAGQRAPWQQHLTLGAGDVLNFSLYGEPTLSQTGVPIGPDGRVNFLEAQDVLAAGLTVDELRVKMDEELAKYRRSPRSMITPVAFNSKKYFLLGSVAHEGVFTLDRPITIVEAVGRAHGLQTALQQRNLVEIADLQRAFLVRNGERLPVDFEKLFERGDLSQNVPLAPDDYLCFPPADLKQVYVTGEVMAPGAAPCTAETSALRVITEQGGFTSRAWKKKILVIRGSLEHPQTFIVDAGDVLSARAPDFKLEPDDIVYVHYRPWIKAEELLDLAATAFIQSATIYWTGIHVGPFISTPFIR